ncbi:MAG: N-acetylmuramoyl-L-alanine amidase [Chitinophagaceae bacterium]|nr:N-acetylmuramoyl-L-alanine amidase [Chitinophagaceae bacterium]
MFEVRNKRVVNLTKILSYETYFDNIDCGDMTRSGDIKVDDKKLSWRVKKAKTEGADMLISIHLNSAAREVVNPETGKKEIVYNEEVRGFVVLHQPGDTKGLKLAQAIAKEQNVIPLKGQGTASQRLQVLNEFRKTGGAGVLIEVGYITNSQDVQAIKEQASKIASQISSGIINYYNNK